MRAGAAGTAIYGAGLTHPLNVTDKLPEWILSTSGM